MTRRISSGTTGYETEGLTFVSNTISTLANNGSITISPAGTGQFTTNYVLNSSANLSSSSASTGSIVITGGFGVSRSLYAGNLLPATFNGINFGSLTPSSASFTTITVNGLSTFHELTETIATKTGATGTVTHDFTETNIWYHSSMSANFTVNLTNTPTTNDRTITINLILIQAGTPYYASGFQVDGVAQTIRWAGYAVPSPQANRFEIQTFTLTRIAGSWTVYGSLSSFG